MIAIVIPCYNEERRIGRVLRDLRAANADWQIIVVDDASHDTSAQRARVDGVTVLQHIVNRGQGAALRTGTRYALKHGADVIVHFDADGQFAVDDIKTVIEPLEQGGADVVFGSRFLGTHDGMPAFKARVIMPLARLVQKLFFNVSLTDPQSGFRAFTREAASQLWWQQDRMAHCSEILHHACSLDLRVQEVPIHVTYHEYGQALSGGFSILRDLLLARFLKRSKS